MNTASERACDPELRSEPRSTRGWHQTPAQSIINQQTRALRRTGGSSVGPNTLRPTTTQFIVQLLSSNIPSGTASSYNFYYLVPVPGGLVPGPDSTFTITVDPGAQGFAVDATLAPTDGSRLVPGPSLHVIGRVVCPKAVLASRLLPNPPSSDRSSLPGSFPDPTKLDTSAKSVGASVGLTGLLMLLLAFPSQLFDGTLKVHYATIRGWFGPLARLDQRTAATLRAWPQWAVFSGFMIVGGLLASMLDPSLGWNVGSLALFLGLVVSRAVITVAFTVPDMIFMRRRYQLRGHFEALPGALLVAAVCVLVSRLADFQPGYLYGVIVGIEFGRKLSRVEDGRLAAWATGWVLVVSLIAWIMWIPVVDAIANGDTSFPILFIDALLAMIFVTGVETVVIGLLPLRMLKGDPLLAWSRRTWAALYLVGSFLFVYVLVHPESSFVGTTHVGGNVTRAMAPFLFFGTISIGTWLYFRNRPEPGPPRSRPGPSSAPDAIPNRAEKPARRRPGNLA